MAEPTSAEPTSAEPTNAKHSMSRYLQQSQQRIFANNQHWVAMKRAEDPKFFDKLAAGQNPEYL
jgi:carbonic anhydrase